MLLKSLFPQPAYDATPGSAGSGVGDPGTPTPAPTPWYAGKADDETIGYFTRRGWDKDPVHAALEASKAHREAEKKLSFPADQIVRIPKEANDAGWSTVWERLGKPKEAKDYDLAAVKDVGNVDLAPAKADAIKKIAHDLNVPKDKAPQLAQAVVKLMAETGAASSAENAQKIAEEKAKLDRDWGTSKAANMVVVQQAAATLGLTPVEVNALENVAGYAKTMEALRQIGIRMGEDRFVRNDLKPGGGLLTQSEAKAKIADLKADKMWVDRYLKGGREEKAEMLSLQKIVSGYVG